MSEEITVLLADDHGLVRRGFRRILEDDEGMKVVGEAANGVEAIRMAYELKPKVVVMDLSMPELDGVQATKEIVKHLPGTEVLILSMHADDNYVRNALDAGAKGYLLKSSIDVDLVGAIRSVAEGKRFMGNGLSVVMTVGSRNDGPGRRGDRKRARGASSYLLGQGAGQQDTPIRTDRGRVNTANAGRRLSRAIPAGQRLKVRGVRITRTGDDPPRRTGRDDVRLSGHGL